MSKNQPSHVARGAVWLLEFLPSVKLKTVVFAFILFWAGLSPASWWA
jgi:hypothetical protein